jgi:hypothetical protein
MERPEPGEVGWWALNSGNFRTRVVASKKAKSTGRKGFEPCRVSFPGPEIDSRVLADSNPWS